MNARSREWGRVLQARMHVRRLTTRGIREQLTVGSKVEGDGCRFARGPASEQPHDRDKINTLGSRTCVDVGDRPRAVTLDGRSLRRPQGGFDLGLRRDSGLEFSKGRLIYLRAGRNAPGKCGGYRHHSDVLHDFPPLIDSQPSQHARSNCQEQAVGRAAFHIPRRHKLHRLAALVWLIVASVVCAGGWYGLCRVFRLLWSIL